MVPADAVHLAQVTLESESDRMVYGCRQAPGPLDAVSFSADGHIRSPAAVDPAAAPCDPQGARLQARKKLVLWHQHVVGVHTQPGSRLGHFDPIDVYQDLESATGLGGHWLNREPQVIHQNEDSLDRTNSPLFHGAAGKIHASNQTRRSSSQCTGSRWRSAA